MYPFYVYLSDPETTTMETDYQSLLRFRVPWGNWTLMKFTAESRGIRHSLYSGLQFRSNSVQGKLQLEALELI